MLVLFRETSDLNSDGIPDECSSQCEAVDEQSDCNTDGVDDRCEIAFQGAPDCNLNGRLDHCELRDGEAADENDNGVPDACEVGFQIPGDCNSDARLDIADCICIVNVLFVTEFDQTFPCETPDANRELLDWNGSLDVDVSDAIAIVNHLFLGRPGHARGGECIRVATCPDACDAPGVR